MEKFMSPSDEAPSFESLASEISALCADAIEADRLGDIPDDSLGQIFASVVRSPPRRRPGRRRGRSAATAASPRPMS
jgi:hypothetical protein